MTRPRRPQRESSRCSGTLLTLAGLSVAALSTGCDERVLVRWSTRVYDDGSAARQLDVSGTDPNGFVPERPDWFIDSPKLDLADILERRDPGGALLNLLAQGAARGGAGSPC